MNGIERRFCRLGLIALLLLLSPSVLDAGVTGTQPAKSAGPAKLEDLRIYLVLKDGNRLIGELAGYDRFLVRVRDVKGKVASARWDELMPSGCYYLQKRLTDPNSAEVNFRLGCYCWSNGLHEQALEHFNRAKRLDPSLAVKIKQVSTGQFAGEVGLAIALSDPKDVEELEKAEQANATGGEGRQATRPDKVEKYQRYSAAFQAKAVEKISDFGRQVNEKLNSKLRTVESDHFLIFTDWPAADDRGLSDMFETIYSRLASQFDMPSSENIYLGKLPVFCWSARESFVKFATDVNRFPVRDTTMAYVLGGFNGMQMMNLYRYPNRLLLEKIVTHECVHTFVNRYKSNIPLEAWLNEGLAEVMAGTLVPRSRVIERARATVAGSLRSIDLGVLLKLGYKMPTPQQYPVALTLVDYLLRKDPARFLAMVDKIKSGTATEAALKDAYGVDYDGLAVAWQHWVAASFPQKPN